MKTELRTQPVWYRPVKLYVAIAAGFVSMLLGLCLGIIITIKNPDGSKTVMQLPPGSKVEVSEGEDAVPGGTSSMDSARLFQAGAEPLLEFGLILDSTTATTETERKYGVRFLAVEDDVQVPQSMFGADIPANKLALVSLNPQSRIRADELWGHVLETKIVKSDDADAIEFTFDESLSKRMLELTTAHAGQQLAIIVEGKVFAAPRIMAPISSKAIITGRFSAEQLQRLQGWLNAAKPVVPDADRKASGSEKVGKAKIDSGTMRGSSMSTEEQQIASDFGAAVADEPVVEFDHRRVHRAIAAFALCLHGDRTAPITETNLEQLAITIAWLDPSRKMKLDSVKRVITKSWPFHGVKAVLPGTPPDASWLTSEGERSFTLVIDPQAIFRA